MKKIKLHQSKYYSYCCRWKKNNPKSYQLLRDACFVQQQREGKFALKNVVCMLRVQYPNFHISDNAVATMAVFIQSRSRRLNGSLKHNDDYKDLFSEVDEEKIIEK